VRQRLELPPPPPNPPSPGNDAPPPGPWGPPPPVGGVFGPAFLEQGWGRDCLGAYPRYRKLGASDRSPAAVIPASFHRRASTPRRAPFRYKAATTPQVARLTGSTSHDHGRSSVTVKVVPRQPRHVRSRSWPGLKPGVFFFAAASWSSCACVE